MDYKKIEKQINCLKDRGELPDFLKKTFPDLTKINYFENSDYEKMLSIVKEKFEFHGALTWYEYLKDLFENKKFAR